MFQKVFAKHLVFCFCSKDRILRWLESEGLGHLALSWTRQASPLETTEAGLHAELFERAVRKSLAETTGNQPKNPLTKLMGQVPINLVT